MDKTYFVKYEVVKMALMYMLRRTYTEAEASNERIFEIVETGTELVNLKWLEDLTGKKIGSS